MMAISSRTSGFTRGRPRGQRERQRQNRRQPLRCQRSTAGRTKRRWRRQFRWRRRMTSQNRRACRERGGGAGAGSGGRPGVAGGGAGSRGGGAGGCGRRRPERPGGGGRVRSSGAGSPIMATAARAGRELCTPRRQVARGAGAAGCEGASEVGRRSLTSPITEAGSPPPGPARLLPPYSGQEEAEKFDHPRQDCRSRPSPPGLVQTSALQQRRQRTGGDIRLKGFGGAIRERAEQVGDSAHRGLRPAGPISIASRD